MRRACAVAMKDGRARYAIKDLVMHAVMTMDNVRMEPVYVPRVGMEDTVLCVSILNEREK